LYEIIFGLSEFGNAIIHAIRVKQGTHRKTHAERQKASVP